MMILADKQIYCQQINNLIYYEDNYRRFWSEKNIFSKKDNITTFDALNVHATPYISVLYDEDNE